MALLGGQPRRFMEDICYDYGHSTDNCICHTLCSHKNLLTDECEACEADSHAMAIYDDQCAELDAMESSMGIELRGWQDSY